MIRAEVRVHFCKWRKTLSEMNSIVLLSRHLTINYICIESETDRWMCVSHCLFITLEITVERTVVTLKILPQYLFTDCNNQSCVVIRKHIFQPNASLRVKQPQMSFMRQWFKNNNCYVFVVQLWNKVTLPLWAVLFISLSDSASLHCLIFKFFFLPPTH